MQSESTSSNYTGKTALIYGLGKSGLAAARFLHSRGAKVKVSEARPRDYLVNMATELERLDPVPEVEYGTNSQEFFADADLIVVSPSVPADSKILEEAQARNILVLTELDLALREMNAPLVAITGSYGKSSLSLLAKTIFDRAGKRCYIAGDLGETLSDYLTSGEQADLVLMEMSEAQLGTVKNIKPDMVVLTCIDKARATANPQYCRNRLSVLRNVDDNCTVIYNYRDAHLRAYVPPYPGQKRLYRRKDPSTQGAEFAQLYRGCYLINRKDFAWTNGEVRETFSVRNSNLYGLHNLENLMGAVNLAKEFKVSHSVIQAAIDDFRGIPHRLEYVKSRGGVVFVNDSRATSVDAMRKSLESFPNEPIIMIAGGKDSQSDFSQLNDIVKKRVKVLILLGESKEHLNRELGENCETYLVGTFDEAILMSYQKSREGDVILFSPGCQSYDMFIDYAQRGNYFKKYLEEIQ